MTKAGDGEVGDRERLVDLAHLSAAIGHSLINAFSAVVSNAELIRCARRSFGRACGPCCAGERNHRNGARRIAGCAEDD